MKKENHTWGTIAAAIKKTKYSVRNWYERNKMLIGLEPKPIIRNLKINGIVGMTIEKIVQEKPSISMSDLTTKLKESLPDEENLPSKSTINRFLLKNDLVLIKSLRKPFIGDKYVRKRLEFTQENIRNIEFLKKCTI